MIREGDYITGHDPSFHGFFCGIVIEVTSERVGVLKFNEHPDVWGIKIYIYFKNNPTFNTKKGVGNMNNTIIESFPATKDAVLVDKWFGSKFNDPIFVLLLKGKEAEILAEAKRLDGESKKEKK